MTYAMVLAIKYLFHDRSTKQIPSEAPPPRLVRALLISTCTAVSFAHGSNDGQKGVGVMMALLVVCLPGKFGLDYVPFWIIGLIGAVMGMGTMIGWKKIVKTIGEKIGKHHMTYAQ